MYKKIKYAFENTIATNIGLGCAVFLLFLGIFLFAAYYPDPDDLIIAVITLIMGIIAFSAAFAVYKINTKMIKIRNEAVEKGVKLVGMITAVNPRPNAFFTLSAEYYSSETGERKSFESPGMRYPGNVVLRTCIIYEYNSNAIIDAIDVSGNL